MVPIWNGSNLEWQPADAKTDLDQILTKRQGIEKMATTPKILAVDDDDDFLELIATHLKGAGFEQVELFSDPRSVVARIDGGDVFDIALIDRTMPEMDGIALLERIKTVSPTTECIMVTAVNEARVVVECLRKGAYDYLVKPAAPEDLLFTISRAMERRRLLRISDIGKHGQTLCLVNGEAFQAILTRSTAMRRVLKEAELHAVSDVPILITGESGTGKELLARAIHMASTRARFAFAPVNMASVSAGLFESEFFGHTKGAFTGADSGRSGYLEQAHRGTLFLDEIGTLPMDLQGKLLRVLQEGEYYKLGTSQQRRVDVRFIAATNEDLEKRVQTGAFRKDLYYRIKGGWLHLPPLRERLEDIGLLAGAFLKAHATTAGECNLCPRALEVLLAYDYPGNVRELRSIVQAAANLCQGGIVDVAALPLHLQGAFSSASLPKGWQPGTRRLAQVEKQHILAVYEATSGNKIRTAKALGIGLNTLRRKLVQYGVN